MRVSIYAGRIRGVWTIRFKVQLNSASLLRWISIVKQDVIDNLVSSFEGSNSFTVYERGRSGFRESRYYSK